MEKKVSIAVIGCGMISGFHLDAITQNPRAELAGVYDAYGPSAQRVARERNTRCFETLGELWKEPNVDAVCICTPSGTHGELATQAVSHGKHVLIEKPMALTGENCTRLAALAEEKQMQVGVVSQLRFAPGIQRVKAAMDRGALGKLLSVELNMKYYRDEAYYGARTWRGTKAMDGGGALMNQGIHGVDLMQYLVGMPSCVFGQMDTLLHNIEVEDTLHALLRFPGGALGTVIATTSVYPGFTRVLTICGEDGTIVLEEDTVKLWQTRAGDMTSDDEASEIRGSSDPSQIGAQGHVLQLGNFVNAILGEEALLLNVHEGRKPVDIILGIYRSARENKMISIGKEAQL